MKRLWILFLFLSLSTKAQLFNKVDSLVASYPRFTSPELLAKKIEQDFTSELDQSRAIFKWLTNNFYYNINEYYNPKPSIRFRYSTEEERLQKIKAIKDQLVKDAFLTKKGVCEEYAQSFKKVADLLGLQALVLKGYTRNSSREIGRPINNSNHAWNAVKIEDQWILLDATWAAGYVMNGKWKRHYNEYYFGIHPKQISKSHFHEDKRWQIALDQGSIESFYNQPIYHTTFLEQKLELISPKTGVLKTSKTVGLKIKNLDPNIAVYYNYQGQRYSKKAMITYKDNIATVRIETPSSPSNLFVFFNRELALSFKITP